jgi:hypothetical protein
MRAGVFWRVGRRFGLDWMGGEGPVAYRVEPRSARHCVRTRWTLIRTEGTYGLALEIAAGLCTLAAVLLLTVSPPTDPQYRTEKSLRRRRRSTAP